MGAHHVAEPAPIHRVEAARLNRVFYEARDGFFLLRLHAYVASLPHSARISEAEPVGVLELCRILMPRDPALRVAHHELVALKIPRVDLHVERQRLVLREATLAGLDVGEVARGGVGHF